MCATCAASTWFVQSNVLAIIAQRMIPTFQTRSLSVRGLQSRDSHHHPSVLTSVEQLRSKKVNVNQAEADAIDRHDLFSFLGSRLRSHHAPETMHRETQDRRDRCHGALTGSPGEIAKLRSKDGFRILPIAFDRRCWAILRPQLTHEDYQI